MSLFPAYASENCNESKQNKDKEEWLTNSSYKIAQQTTPEQNETYLKKEKQIVFSKGDLDSNRKETCSSSDIETSKKHTKSKKVDTKKEKRKSLAEKIIYNEFTVDKKPERVYLSIPTISRPAVPKYKVTCLFLGYKGERKKHKSKLKRYYHLLHKHTNKTEKDVSSENKFEEKSVQETEEVNITKNTFHFNQELGKNPFNIEMWLDYIKYQDVIYQFEKTYKKGSAAKGIRATAERKIAMIDKALTHNPGNVRLLRERLKTCETVFPADELREQLKKLVDKDSGNIILWQGYIEATQCSMAHCNTTSVIAIYNQCLNKLHQLRRYTAEEKSLLEEKILSILYQCGLFLRQAGLWEQLWTLLRLYLVLNLAEKDKNKYNILSGVSDQQLLELEEVVLDSKLPLHELWLRIERLRESSHWLPWTNREPCEDPQRTVFIDDVSDLIHPITSTGNVFKLTVMVLTLLKVPLLPFRHTTLKQLGLDYVPWALDTIETLLPIYYPSFLIDTSEHNILNELFKFAVGPQYLKTHPGQEEYLDFIITVMRKCAECLESTERTAIYIWWLRFERLLIILDRNKSFKMPAGRTKKVKSTIKEFLKHNDNRNNVLFYKEYALIEYELGNIDSSRKVLLTAISMQEVENKTIPVLNEETRTNLCSLYRTLIETYIVEKSNIETNKQKAIYYLISLVNKNLPKTDAATLCDNLIKESLDQYNNITDELLTSATHTVSIAEHFLPDFTTDWIMCHGLFLYLVKTPFESGILMEKALKKFEEVDQNWRQEVLMEWYVSMLYKNCTEKLGQGLYKLFRDTLYKALTQVPNNLFLLTIASLEQTSSGCVGQTWWKLSNILINSGHSIPALFLIIMLNNVLTERVEQWSDIICSSNYTMSSIKNRMMSTFTKLTTSNICTKRCGLIWRLYLQFLYNYSDPESCRKIYYAAVEECPWLKALYIDAAIYIPAELCQIQDLIIEKELRIHVTPEELEILRT